VKDKLKPCPFCGGKAYISNEDCYGYEHDDFIVNCDECNLQFGFASQFETEEDAVKAWNTRKPIDKVIEQLEELVRINMEVLGVRADYVNLAHVIKIVKAGEIDE
jgi:Lar family restriction alleviation protein